MGRPNHVALQIMIDWHDLSATVDQALRRADGRNFSMRSSTPGWSRCRVCSICSATLERHGASPKAIATSSRRSFVEDVLSRFALVPRFDFLLTSESVTQGKPHPEVYQKAAATFGISTGEMAVLEDSANGCHAAVTAGTVSWPCRAGIA